MLRQNSWPVRKQGFRFRSRCDIFTRGYSLAAVGLVRLRVIVIEKTYSRNTNYA